MPVKRPNVLMIVTDQEQPWALHPKSLKLPGRARLAERATHFTQFHISGSICSPCRSVLYTGHHWQATRVYDNIQRSGAMSPQVPTLGTMLQGLGYRTGYRGKWHVSFLDGGPANDFSRCLRPYGFETYSDLPDVNGAQDGYHRDPVVLAETREFLAAAETDERPWFLAVNFINPHDIMFFRAWAGQAKRRTVYGLRPAPDDPLYTEFVEEEPPPNFGTASLAGKPAAIPRCTEVYNSMLGPIPFEDPAVALAYRQYYWACMRDVDRHISAVLDALDQSGQADDTIIVFTTDHGEMGGAHGLRDKGSACYRELSNVPMLITHPEVSGGRESTALMSQVDVVPTVLSMIGAQSGDKLAGVDMSTALSGGAGPRAETGVLLNVGNLIFLDPAVFERIRGGMDVHESRALADYGARGMARGVFDGRYKFVRWFGANDHHVPRDFETLTARNDLELYDTASDPYEIDNLARTPGRVRDLLTSLNAKCNALIEAEVERDDGSWLDL
ncbi:MAG: sulfatase-like hydrolase/transferase [Alphaproteobacteria bacterium]